MQISDIEWNTTALQNLVLDEGEKRLLTAMISSKSGRSTASFDDFVDGKGKELTARPMNGRQIKSAVKTARILAQSEGGKLGNEHLQLVLGLREKAQTLIR
jgi:hypothetical protein